MPASAPVSLPAAPLRLPPRLQVLHADEQVVVLDKPAGVLAVPGRGEGGGENLFAAARLQWPDLFIVHRLDQATSGLIAFARGAVAARALGEAFASRQVEKRYVARVQGWPELDEGRIDLPLAADWPNRPRQKVDARQGKPALTLWRVLEREAGGAARLALQPVTGRSHQLRVHLAALGHAIVGDALYGAAAADRLHLHAAWLRLPHPAQAGRWLELQSPVPF